MGIKQSSSTQHADALRPTAPTPTVPAHAFSPFVAASAQPTTAPMPQQHVAAQRRVLLPFVLLVLDGWGVAPASRGNAISLARTPNMDRLMQLYPTVTLHASGEMVGLPRFEKGNSEVGHLNIGSGKIIYQHFQLINKQIEEGAFFKNSVFVKTMREVKNRGGKLHLMGMVSAGGVHSSQDHLHALLELCQKEGVTNNVFIHAFLDGRDTKKDEALSSIATLETKMRDTGVGRIASLSGRFYAMDRDNHWDRIEQAYAVIRHGKSDHVFDSPLKAIEVSYSHGVFDEEFVPTVIMNDTGTPVATVDDNDAIIFFNFRADRARELTKAFVLPGFTKFDRGQVLQNLTFVSMTEYEKNLPLHVAFQPDNVRWPVARVISDAGWKQLHIAETEKYAHVTFFFNGGAEEPFPGEDRVLIPSKRVISYDATPAMCVHEIAERLVQEIHKKEYQCIIANFANADMVGHTGNLQATIAAVEEADRAIGAVAQAVLEENGTLVITADHGNAEEMIAMQTGETDKEHSASPVPFIMANSVLQQQRMMWPPVPNGDLSRMQPSGVLSDVAPTILSLIGLPIPKEMTSHSLLRALNY